MTEEERHVFARQELISVLTDLGIPFEVQPYYTQCDRSTVWVGFDVEGILARARTTNTALDLQEIIRGLEE